MKVLSEKQFKKLAEDHLIVDDKFKDNKVSGNKSFSGLCCFCGELIERESQRVPVHAKMNSKVAHRNCLDQFCRINGYPD